MEISEVMAIFSELKDSVPNIRRKEIQVFINLDQKKLNAFLVYLHSLRVYQIQICSFVV